MLLSIPLEIRGMSHKATGKRRVCREGERSKRKVWSSAFTGVSMAKARKGRVTSLELTSMHNSDGFWSTEVVLGCLVPGPGLT
jgi:hypothetical protein